MKPTIKVKQNSHVTTVSLKNMPFGYIIATNDQIQKLGIVAIIKQRLDDCRAKGYKHATAKHEALLKALGACQNAYCGEFATHKAPHNEQYCSECIHEHVYDDCQPI